MIAVVRACPTDAGPDALLAEGQALQAALYPPQHNHALPTAALLAPEVRFFAARDGDDVLGVAALLVTPCYGEVKSMFTAPAARGRGVGTALLEAFAAVARAEGLTALKLETGAELDAACRLYERQGFRPCGAFGDYLDDGASVFMEKPLA